METYENEKIEEHIVVSRATYKHRCISSMIFQPLVDCKNNKYQRIWADLSDFCGIVCEFCEIF